jgi:hypothetical protein
VLALYVALQIVVPFRHLAYPGPVDWTEEGHRFAWRMKLRDKRGTLEFKAVDRASRKVIDIQHATDALTTAQSRMMIHDPEMIRQYSRFLAGVLRQAGYGVVEIYALTRMSLNGRPAQPMIRPDVSLATLEPGRPVGDWIVPLRPADGE